ncbi:valine--tRNA ligase [Chloroflexota bacterium]
MTQTAHEHDEMPKAYESGKVEQKWYRFWMDKGYFKPQIDPEKKPFVIIMPPPNVTGELHLGHAITATLEDIMTRWHRMRGEAALWLPGVDHAGIATQVVVEKVLAKEGVDRHKLGREKTRQRIREWAESRKDTIRKQHQRLGASCDWSREHYTLDEGPSRAVRAAFVRLFQKGLIYRGERIINWCPRCATALSDLETDHKDLTGHLYHLRYPVADKENEYVIVATTRPETYLGDTAVAVNPGDERYQGMVGKKVVLPIINREIPIVADDAVDLAFGTGAVKITPAHDPVDFEVAQRQGLELINILNPDATMNENAGPYAGMDRFACRQAVLDDLEKQGFLVKVEPYGHSVGHCQRCQTVVEPTASKQWFVKVAPLAKPAIAAVVDGRITIIPQRFTKVYLNWMENIRDWCISRQLWWGHRIPVWYCRDCDEITVALDEPKACASCSSTNIEQDPDVLDTWFSSALWPHSTLGWPDDTEDLRYFYPTAVMETAYDILFFWVARMIMMGLEDAGDIPFRTVYLHGLIRDEKGDKMSKTRGNVIDPLVLMDKYGTDALRHTLTTGTAPGNDIKLSDTKLEAGRNFANKLWNAGRFVVRSIQQVEGDVGSIDRSNLLLEDRWILSHLHRTIASVLNLMEDFQFGEAQRQLHDFLWGEYCDWYIEFAKIRLNAGDNTPLPVLIHVLETSLRLLHPYMPFLTEELWQHLKPYQDQLKAESIMVAPYPEVDETAIDGDAEEVIETIIEVIRSIRNVRAQYRVESGRWIEARIYADHLISALSPYTGTIQNLSRAKPVTFFANRQDIASGENAVSLVLKEVQVVIPMASMIDQEAEKQRMNQEMAQTQAEISRLEDRINDKQFLTKAPPAVVEREKQRLNVLADKMARLKQQVAKL